MIAKRKSMTKQSPAPLTRVAFYLIVIAAGVMIYLYILHKDIPADAGWVQYCLYMTAFAIAGLVGIQILNNDGLIPQKFQPLDLNTGVRAAMILAASMITQIIVRQTLSFSAGEQALYFVFAAVCEEVFFRGLIISMVLKFAADIQTKIFAIILQAVMFAAIHQNYYANLPMLFSVFIGGIVLGIFYVVWKDLTANILAHFVLNLIAVQSLLIIL
jgi:membrane protease YdiL (CAAX protease family)